MKQHDAPTLAEKMKKQVRFDIEGDQVMTLALTQGLTLFLTESTAEERDDAPGPNTAVLRFPIGNPSEGPQCHPTHTGLKSNPD